MEQMQAIWSALDEILDQDPKKYEEFIKSQVEAGLAAFADGGTKNACTSNVCRKSDFTSILSSLSERNSDPKKKEKSESTEVGKGDCCKLSDKTKNAAEVIKKKNLANYENPGVGDDEDKAKDKPFELRLPSTVAPTQVKSGQGKIMIEEISTEVKREDNLENKSKI